MSRAEKQQRRMRRKDRARRLASRRDRGRFGEFLENNPSLRLLEYDVTEDGLDLEEEPELVLGAMSGEEVERLYDQVHHDPARAIAALEPLIRQNPDSRTLRNWLSTAYAIAGDFEAADRVTRELYERFPDYLFARIGMADICMRRGETERVPAIFDNKFDLKLLYPHRSVFHISEYLGFSSVMIQYYLRIGERDAAEVLHEIMCEMAPDHPITEQITKVMTGSVVLRMLERLAQMARR